jgi:hypothetical protein
MAQQNINLGIPNNEDGDLVRSAFSKAEDNFTELYARTPPEVDRIISGSFIWTEVGLEFEATPFVYSLSGQVNLIGYSIPYQPNIITLDTPDGGETNPRIDLIVIDGDTKSVVVVKGAPAPTPQEPTLQFGSQLRITAIYVPPTGVPGVGGGNTTIETIKIYDENLGDPAEWDITALTGTGVVSDDLTVGIPLDTYNIKFPGNIANQLESVEFTAATLALFNTNAILAFQLKQSERWDTATRLIIKVEDSSTTEATIELDYTSILEFGFETANDATWMTVVIPLNRINIGSTLSDINKITIEAWNNPILYIDNIIFQTGIETFNGVIVPTKTSDLINDGEDGINPFITDLGIVAIIKLDEGNGIGYVSEGSDRTLFGNIGRNALDLSLSTGVSTTRGATGEHSVALGDDVTASGYGSMSIGYNNTASGDFSFSQGYTNSSGGYSDAVYGTFNTSTEPSNINGYRFIAGLRNTVDVTLGGVALGNGHHVSSFGTTAVGQASLQTSGGANVGTSPMLVVGNGDFNYTGGILNVISRSDAFVVYKSGSVVAPSLTTALIDGEATGKALVTKEWITGQGFGDYVDLINPQSVYGIKTFYDNLYVNQFGNTGVATFGIGAVQQLYNYTTNDYQLINTGGRLIMNASGKYTMLDSTGFSVATDSSTTQRGYLLTDNLTGQQILQYPDASGTLVLLENDNAFTGKNTFNNSSNYNIVSTNTRSSLGGILSDNTFTGIGITATNSNDAGISIQSYTLNGDGIVSVAGTTGTGNVFVGQNNYVDTFTVNKEGDITANSINIGGAGANVLLDDGNLKLLSELGGGATGSDIAYDATTWDANTDVPTKNVIRDLYENKTFKVDTVGAAVPIVPIYWQGTQAEFTAKFGATAPDNYFTVVTDANPPAITAGDVVVDASGFVGNLTGTDTSTQEALNTIDALVLGGTGTIGGSISDNQVAIGATTAGDIEGDQQHKVMLGLVIKN